MSRFRAKIAHVFRGAGDGGSRDDDQGEEISQLFDLSWWRLTSGRKGEDLRDAWRSYVAGTPGSPHPLWLPAPVTSTAGATGSSTHDARPPAERWITYLRERQWHLEVHPLFDVAGYVERYPEALSHEAGPIGHYCSEGAARGALINSWYLPDPDRQPRGLVDWLFDRAREWDDRRRPPMAVWTSEAPTAPEEPPSRDAGLGQVSVLVVGLGDEQELLRTIASISSQTYRDLQILVAAPTPADPALLPLEDGRVRFVATSADPWSAWAELMESSAGEWIAFAAAGDQWPADRLRRFAAARGRDDGSEAHAWWHDVADRGGARPFLGRRVTRAAVIRGARLDPSCLFLSGAAARDHGLDARLGPGAFIDLVLAVADSGDAGFVPAPGPRLGRSRERRALHAQGHPSVRDAALARHLVDWVRAEDLTRSPGVTSVLIPTYRDHEMTCGAVESVVTAAPDQDAVEIIVIDNGSGLESAAVLSALPERFPRQVRVLHQTENHGFALGNDIGVGGARGDVIVFLNNDARVADGWLEPLRAALEDERVLGAQALLLLESGAVQSAGIVFPPGDSLPHELLRGHPREDAEQVVGLELSALTGAALALRTSDVVRARGFDPLFRNGLEDVDLCLRLAEARAGYFVVPAGTVVTHLESRSEGRFDHVVHNRRVFLQRWRGRLPDDDARAWARAGFDLLGRRPRPGAAADNRLRSLDPVLVRTERPRLHEAAPRLRWAIKNPALSGPRGDTWGDTAYAETLARALRELGQQVVVDRRKAFDRSTGWHDDVVLGLHGRVAPTPVPDQVNLLWVISHPQRLAQVDLTGWDQIFVASTMFAETVGSRVQVPVTTLYQATDPGSFHPDRAQPDSGVQLLFLGNSRGARRPMVDHALAAGLPLTLVGGEWEGLVPPGLVEREFIANDDVGVWYRSASIVLNDHWEDMRETGFLSNRLFDAVASGARVVSDDVVGLREVLGGGVVVVDGPDALREVVASDYDTTFGDDDERRRRAAEVAHQHSFLARAEELLDAAVRTWRVKAR